MLVLFELLCMAIIVLWYPVLPFCFMNPKGEKNSLVQVLQMIFTEVADMIQMVNLQVHQF